MSLTTLLVSLLSPNLSWSQSVGTSVAAAPKSPVDVLIPWLLQEGNTLHGIPFSEVIFAATGKHVLPIDPKNETDQRVIKQISDALDEVMRRLNAPASVIQGIPRINEVSSHFEDSMRELLNTAPGLSCDFPRTAEDRVQRSGYPDLRLVDQETKRVFYLDPKLYAVGSRDSSFRTFYFEPKGATNKVRDDGVHFIVGAATTTCIARKRSLRRVRNDELARARARNRDRCCPNTRMNSRCRKEHRQ